MADRRQPTPLQELPLLELIQRAEQEHRGQPAPTAVGAMALDAQLRETLSACIAASGLSRWDIVARMGELMNVDVSTSQLNAWTAPSHEGHRFPAAYLPAFCRAVGSVKPLELLAHYLDVSVLRPRDVVLARRAETELTIRRLTAERRALDGAIRLLEGEDHS